MARRDAVKRFLLPTLALLALLAVGLYWIAGPRAPTRVNAPPLAKPEPEFAATPLATAAKPRSIANSKESDAAVEICDIGNVRPAADDEGAYSYVSELAKPAMRRWLGALRNSDDYRTRALGIFVTSVFDNAPGQPGAVQTGRDELVAMAVGSTDPAIYAIALKSCSIGQAEPSNSCSQLSPEAWANLDPDNAVPWLLLAARLRENKDAAGEAAAFARASSARKSESYTDSLLNLAELDMPGDATPLESWSLGISMIGVEAAMAYPTGPAFAYCSKRTIQNKTEAARCGALAELWVAHPGNVINLMLGQALGERVGWPQQRIKDLRERAAAYMQLLNDAVPAARDRPWTCEAVAQGNAFVAKRSRLGEIGLAQDLLDHSETTIAELAQKYNDTMKKMLEEAQRAGQEKPLP